MVKEQGEALGKLEDYINDVDIEIKKAESEIYKASKDGKRNSKKLLWLSMILLFVFFIVVIVIIIAVTGNK